MDVLPFSFLGLEGRDSKYRLARFAVLPVPYDGSTSYRSGTRDGPAAILSASRQVELFDPDLGGEIHRPGVATCDPLYPSAAGPEQVQQQVYQAVRKLLRDGKFPIVLGGEHSISVGAIRACIQKFRKLNVLHIDAHLDMRDTWQGSKYSHACVLRRVHELGVPSVSVGIRNISLEESRYIRKNRVPVWTMDRIRRSSGTAPIWSGGWIGEVLDALPERDPVYLTFDLDGMDPSVAPGVGTPEPGGLDWPAFDALMKGVCGKVRLVGMDVVELMPLPGQVVSEFFAARAIGRILALVQKHQQRSNKK